MKYVHRAAIPCLLLMVSVACSAQSAIPNRSAHITSRRPQGFLDYALGKINPSDKEYGNRLADARHAVVGDTIQNLYFWSNLVSLSLLAVASTALVLVLRTQDKREIIAANLIAQLWNGRVTDRLEIVRRTGLYNALVETKNTAMTMEPPTVKEDRAEPLPLEQSFRKQAGNKNRVPSERVVANQLSSHTQKEETNDTVSGDLDQGSKLLEGQNQALRNSERNLRERLRQITQDLEHERRRNQTLKGA